MHVLHRPVETAGTKPSFAVAAAIHVYTVYGIHTDQADASQRQV